MGSSVRKLAGSSSPSRSGGSSSQKPLSLSSSVMDHHPPVMELVAKESTVAMWHLQRRMDWVENKQPIDSPPDIKLQMRRLCGEYVLIFIRIIY